jgi:hypothetical protein
MHYYIVIVSNLYTVYLAEGSNDLPARDTTYTHKHEMLLHHGNI